MNENGLQKNVVIQLNRIFDHNPMVAAYLELATTRVVLPSFSNLIAQSGDIPMQRHLVSELVLNFTGVHTLSFIPG